MSPLFKKSIILTLLIFVPMVSTDLVLSRVQNTDLAKELLILGVLLAGTIVYLIKVKPMIEKKTPPDNLQH